MRHEDRLEGPRPADVFVVEFLIDQREEIGFIISQFADNVLNKGPALRFRTNALVNEIEERVVPEGRDLRPLATSHRILDVMTFRERRMAGEHKNHDHAKSVNVNRSVHLDLTVPEEFGWFVSDVTFPVKNCYRAVLFGAVEIEEAHFIISSKHNVGRCQIEMRNLGFVELLEG
jgi:hypothetical protein